VVVIPLELTSRIGTHTGLYKGVKSFQRELDPSVKKVLKECGVISCETERVETMSMENHCNVPGLRLIIHLLN